MRGYVFLRGDVRKGKLIPYRVVEIVDSDPAHVYSIDYDNEAYMILAPIDGGSCFREHLDAVAGLDEALDIMIDYAYALEEEAGELWTTIKNYKAQIRTDKDAFVEKLLKGEE